MGILLAILAAAGWGATNIFARLGFSSAKSLSPVGGVFASMLSSLAAIALVNLVFQREALAAVSTAAILWFALIGLTTFVFARYCNFKGVELIGASRASALSAAAPLFAMLVAVVFLHERLTPVIFTGIMLIMGGLFTLSGHQENVRDSGAAARITLKRANLWGYIFSMLSALGWGGTAALTRWGVTHLAPPLVGVLLSMTVGTLVLSLPGIRNLKSSRMPQGSGLGFFLLAGLMSAIGTAASYGALKFLPVVVANPLANTTPLFTILYTLAFLRGWERITRRTCLGAVLVIAGSTFITLGRTG